MKLRQSDPDHAPANFNPVARPYRWMEYLTFGRSLERCRTHFLPQFANRRSALVLGDGDGRFLARLLAANPSLHADAVDTSANMLHLLTHRAQAVSPHIQTCLRTHQTSALTFTPDRTYDLIVTHFFIDCLTQSEVDTLAQRLARFARPDTVWLFSDFRIPAGAMHWPARALVRLLYLGFRILTGLRTAVLPDHAAALGTAGFTRSAHHYSLAGLLTSEIWEYTPSMLLPPQRPNPPYPPDPVPDPEPPSPSLPEPDPGVFHREPGCPPKPSPPTACND
jgi:ubiquinone/menaquinone biosynthesis C-methylase UbiE